MTNPPPPGMYPPPQPLYGQQLLPGWEERTRGNAGGGGNGGDGPFLDAFDFSFDSYATPAVVKVLFVLIVISTVVVYVGTVLGVFAVSLPDRSIGGIRVTTGSPIPGIATLVIGWIPAFVFILMCRVGLEQALAAVRTAIDARALRTHYVGRV